MLLEESMAHLECDFFFVFFQATRRSYHKEVEIGWSSTRYFCGAGHQLRWRLLAFFFTIYELRSTEILLSI